MKKKIVIQSGNEVAFYNQVDYCIGTGRMGLALQQEYQNQLKLVQEYIGFSHIRGHGLFCDDMAIYQERVENGEIIAEYNYTYLDLVMDSYRELGLKPFLELGFMPSKMASGEQTVFYWKGNVTPPKSYEAWTDMVQNLLCHLMERYGEEEVVTWPIEVWNEPNLKGFWENADMQEYFKLFHKTFLAIKKIDERFRVGGPAVCGGSDELWIQAFMEYCQKNKLLVDFVTRHHYTTELPVKEGHYGYAELMEPEDGFSNLKTTRDIIDSYEEYSGLKIHITEFNTSYIPNCPLHDTNQNAAFIAHQLSRLGDHNESYSYWTFGDIFEERGVPFTPFHGGFGLVANGCIPKPTFWTFAFFKKLKEIPGKCVCRDDNTVVMETEDGGYRGIAWNMTRNRSGRGIELEYLLEVREKQYCLVQQRVDEETCNPLKLWHDMGEPANPSKKQTRLLQEAAHPFITSDCAETENGKISINIALPENAVVYFELEAVQTVSDNGYSYPRVMQQNDINPLIGLDYPDPDVIRVQDTYYMVSTTMHFMPGCEILRSYDLIHWEHAVYVYDTLDGTPGQKLVGEENIYGKGMWAATIRYHKGVFYVCFVANDTGKTYLYTSKTIEGTWKKSTIKGFCHDCSLLFDDDDRVYIVSGNSDIRLVELKADLSGPLEGGLDRILVSDVGNTILGYEGSHFYKINGRYYLFLIHSKRDRWRRVEACFTSDSLEGEFIGGDVLDDDRNYLGQGVAQGGIVDTPDGEWYAVLFQDYGAEGRIPVLVPISWEEDYPVFGENGKVPKLIQTKSTRPDYIYEPLIQSDDFKSSGDSFGLKSVWQFNHEPDMSLFSIDREQGIYEIRTGKLCSNLTQAVNTITQRMIYPGCSGEVTVDAKNLTEGDYAGICALQGCYGMAAVTRRDGRNYLVMHSREAEDDSLSAMKRDDIAGKEWDALPIEGDVVRLKAEVEFTNMKDEVQFYYHNGCNWAKIGIAHKLFFKIDHFVGCRFGLFLYATRQTGGTAKFQDFKYTAAVC